MSVALMKEHVNVYDFTKLLSPESDLQETDLFKKFKKFAEDALHFHLHVVKYIEDFNRLNSQFTVLVKPLLDGSNAKQPNPDPNSAAPQGTTAVPNNTGTTTIITTTTSTTVTTSTSSRTNNGGGGSAMFPPLTPSQVLAGEHAEAHLANAQSLVTLLQTLFRMVCFPPILESGQKGANILCFFRRCRRFQ
jgi:hypothetical protein